MEQASCRNCQNIDYNRKETLEGRLSGRYRYGCDYCKSGYICGVISDDDKLEILVCPGWKGSGRQREDIQELSRNYDRKLQELYDRWNLWRQIGAPEAALPDGVYLNNLRKGIQALLKQIEDALPEDDYPECFHSPLPPLMDPLYMADTIKIRKEAERALEAYAKNPNHQWIAEHYAELSNDDPETAQAYRLLCHKKILSEAIQGGDTLIMKRASCQKSLYEELVLCRKRMEKRLHSGKKRRRKNGEKVQITGQLDIAELKVS